MSHVDKKSLVWNIIGKPCLLFLYYSNFYAKYPILCLRKTVRDHANQENIKLSDEDLEIIRNIQTSHFPEGGFDPYEVEYILHEPKLNSLRDVFCPWKSSKNQLNTQTFGSALHLTKFDVKTTLE